MAYADHIGLETGRSYRSAKLRMIVVYTLPVSKQSDRLPFMRVNIEPVVRKFRRIFFVARKLLLRVSWCSTTLLNWSVLFRMEPDDNFWNLRALRQTRKGNRSSIFLENYVWVFRVRFFVVQMLIISAPQKVPSSMAATSAEYRKTLEQVIVMSFPFAPHFSAELWTGIQSVARANAIAATNVWEVPWPQLDYSYDLDLLVQVRATVGRKY